MNKICQGCFTYDELDPDSCVVLGDKKEDICPCPNCLVKVMCECSCEEMSILTNSIYKINFKDDPYVEDKSNERDMPRVSNL